MTKQNGFVSFVLIFIIIFFSISTVTGHTPLNPGEEFHSLETAYEVPNPTKSWTLYRELHHQGDAEYYKLQLKTGERLRVSIYTKEIEDTFFPHLIIMSKNFQSDQDIRESIEVPAGYGAKLIQPEFPKQPEYEPFTPASYYYLISVNENITQTGDYFLVIYEPNQNEGKYGIAIGYREEFTLAEWLMIPIDVINIHQWEGQPLILILSPLIITLIIGSALIVRKSSEKIDLFKITGSVSGLFYIGSGLITLMQMIIAIYGAQFNSNVILTLIFVIIPLTLGFLLIRKTAQQKRKITIYDRAFFIALGLIGMFTWSGLFIGPALAIVVGLIPIKTFNVD